MSSYILCEDSLSMETYLETVLVNIFRVSVRKFRLPYHDLAKEKGTHNDINRDNRTCTYCKIL